MTTFRASDVDIFRPYPDEVPWELLAEAGVDERALAAVMDLDFLRVAKHEGRIVGAYAIRPRTETCYELVALIVDGRYRRRGVGRWLLGHAIGLAETKGGREIVADLAGATTGRTSPAHPGAARAPGDGRSERTGERFLTRHGFEPFGTGLRLVLTPE